MPLSVSVVTPSFNQGRFIERTIRSVLDQDVPGLDYLVVDGASTDETTAVLRRYDSKLRWVSEPDKGQADAVNKGFRATAGEVVGWLNSDDVYYPGALRAVCDYFEAHPEVDVLYGDAQHIDENDAVMEPYYTEEWDPQRLRDVCFLCQPAVFLRRRVLERHGLLDAGLRYCMDYEYWLRLADGGARFARLRQFLAGSRLHADTKTLGSRVAVHREINDMMRGRLGRVPTRWLFNYAHAVLDTRGLPRALRLRFTVVLCMLTCYASLRWNRALSRDVLSTALHFLRVTFSATLSEVWSK